MHKSAQYFKLAYKIVDVPTTYAEAISSPESEEWKKAMKEEMDALEESETFELQPLPENRSVIGGRWVYTKKTDLENLTKYKARYVAKGFSQVKGIDFHETFLPTAKFTTIRMLMQIAVQKDLIVHQMDVKTAYLNADIDCDIFLQQPEGFVKTNSKGEILVGKLKKSLYGLKQSGRNWYKMLHEYLVNNNFVQSLSDPCL